MTTCLEKSCSFDLPLWPIVNCCQFMYFHFGFEGRMWDLIYQFLFIAYRFTLYRSKVMVTVKCYGDSQVGDMCHAIMLHEDVDFLTLSDRYTLARLAYITNLRTSY